VLDLDTKKVVWATRGPWRDQHEARFLDDGTLMLFDNAGAFPPGRVKPALMRSRILRYDTVRGAITSSYEGDPAEPIYSPTRGTLQLLPDGRMLVGVSDAGLVQLVGADARVLWEYQTFGRRKIVTSAMLVPRAEASFIDGR
jgi:hypothetical protein